MFLSHHKVTLNDGEDYVVDVRFNLDGLDVIFHSITPFGTTQNLLGSDAISAKQIAKIEDEIINVWVAS
jgi:hypothetical protein